MFGSPNKQTTEPTKISASSYYPNRGDTTHVLSSLDPNNIFSVNSDTNNDNVEDEDDWFEVVPPDATHKVSARTSEAMMTEVSRHRCSFTPLISTFTAALLAGRCEFKRNHAKQECAVQHAYQHKWS